MKFRKTVADLVDDRLARLIKRMRKLKPATIPYSASATFFAIPELRDLVLEHLDFVELFAVRRVCRGWDESIRTHSALRRTTNLDPRVRTQVEKQTLPRDLGSEDTGVPSQVYRVLPRFFKDKMLPQKFEVGPFTCKRYEMRNIADTETLYIRYSATLQRLEDHREWRKTLGFHGRIPCVRRWRRADLGAAETRHRRSARPARSPPGNRRFAFLSACGSKAREPGPDASAAHREGLWCHGGYLRCAGGFSRPAYG